MQTNAVSTSDWLLATQHMKMVPLESYAGALMASLIGSPSIGTGATLQSDH